MSTKDKIQEEDSGQGSLEDMFSGILASVDSKLAKIKNESDVAAQREIRAFICYLMFTVLSKES